MSGQIVNATDATFEAEVLQSDLPVLVDYWAPWCGPCKVIAPVLEQLAEEYAGRLKVVKVDVQDNRDVPARFGIRNIPTLSLFRNGNVEATKVGAHNKAVLSAFIDSHL